MAMMYEGPVRKISSPEEEIAHLRAQVEAKERELAGMKQGSSRESITKDKILHHLAQPVAATLAPGYHMQPSEAEAIALALEPESDDETMNELRGIMETRGIYNAFSVLKNLKNPHLEDDFHRFLVAYLLVGMKARGLSETGPEWKSLHMTLYEIMLPQPKDDQQDQDNLKYKHLKELVSSMEQFYSGMMSVHEAYPGEPAYYSLELAVPTVLPHLRFYASVPNSKCDLFEKQTLALYPDAVVTKQNNDYNVFTQEGVSLGSVGTLHYQHPLSIKDYTEFDYDPLNQLLNAFSKIQAEGEGASVQFVIKPPTYNYGKAYEKILKALRKGESKSKAFEITDHMWLELWREIRWMFRPAKDEREQHQADEKVIESIEKKRASPVAEVNIRLIASSSDEMRSKLILSEMEASFNQYLSTTGNSISFKRLKGGALRKMFRAFSWRLFSDEFKMPLSLREITTMYHYPPKGIKSAPHLKQATFKSAPAPIDLDKSGTHIGTNTYRGTTTDIYMDIEDRLRHMYVIGQTGAGKSGFLQTLIIQDIKDGNGVCFIDPHGKDVLDILASIPPERYEDVIYFDPANIDRPFGLNMLEYDVSRPEQKTFIVNELLMIFRQLYGDVPESMGPAFEQYFRNSTQLVMEDPDSGSTMMDIARVLSDSDFRREKLMKSNNQVVNQFWEEIATKAEGDSSLANIVPYITNKFDEFTANDFMRPIIGQQTSSFKFREVIDTKKILLVNLSKGRLGERNANLLGLIIVGKLFMAALSRSDNPRGDFPPFFLYIDEFQNISTSSISGILSEARKYKLSLTIAHQFIKQVDEKIRDAVFGNVGSMTIFRVGQEDSELFAKLFAPEFTALDFTNITNRNAYIRLLAHGVPQKPFNMETLDLRKIANANLDQVDDLRELSYLTYGRDRVEVEATIREKYLSRF